MATKNVVVIGGSYVGMNTAESLANASQGRFRVLLIEKNSHFQHLFAFPRYAVTKQVPTHKAFIPYQAKKLGADGAIVQAAAIGLTKDKVLLDRSIMLDGKPVDRIPFVALVCCWPGIYFYHNMLMSPGHYYRDKALAPLDTARLREASWDNISTQARSQGRMQQAHCRDWCWCRGRADGDGHQRGVS
jgi:hypothetical protein